MDTKLKKEWVAALRSGEYKQGKGRLFSSNNGGSFCCLGVLCDIGVDGHWEYGTKEKNKFISKQGEFNNHDVGNLSHIKGFPGFYDLKHLARMNDEGKSFEEIANYIEKNL